ncbi:MAG: signal recognition particle-docking protein FtsY [Oscillospiraceae bacterium]|nr:signal recognition particle-docking protein FtsY [Oscillospiraceae bacterium]MCL2151565.1 signal recognition particle-docking protein FtsY [Oscillospiraceae bacterium]
MGFINKIREGLLKTKKSISTQLGNVFAAFSGAEDDFYDELEETLIIADLGAKTAACAVETLRETARREGYRSSEELKAELSKILAGLLDIGDGSLKLGTKPSVILVVGVNGVGKTTTIGKLALRYASEGKKVLLCAGDTFRAAASEQLSVWANRAGADIVRREEGADPASVIFDGINAGKARGADVIICDTAGRLHNKSNLMNELNKISRVIDRELPGADRETLLVLDATTGQNGLIQAKQFKETADVTGIVLTKLDGTARGGIVYAIASELGVPVKLVGVGEKPEDLIEFDGQDFSEAILE